VSHRHGKPYTGQLSDRMKEYLRREVPRGLEFMLEENALMHVFDLDKGGQYVFVMAMVTKDSIGPFEQYMRACESSDVPEPQSGTKTTKP